MSTVTERASGLYESLQQSAKDRADMVARLGCIPLSILRGVGRGALSNRLFQYQWERPGTKVSQSPAALDKAARFAAIGIEHGGYGAHTGRGTPDYGLTILPAELVRFFIRYYAGPGDTYLDPFMGQGVQLQVAKLCGLHYYGYDCCAAFCRYIDKIVPKIDDHTTVLSATCGDSRHPDAIPDAVGTFGFTSPPYWDIEYYDDSPTQIGTNHTYNEFLTSIEDIARAWLPKFVTGAYFVVNVGDFRKGGRFYPYGAHTILAYERAGWQMHDVFILEGLVGGLQKSFAVSRNNERIVPRVHEYALVFRAP